VAQLLPNDSVELLLLLLLLLTDFVEVLGYDLDVVMSVGKVEAEVVTPVVVPADDVVG
jgi:hypothetical protein